MNPRDRRTYKPSVVLNTDSSVENTTEAAAIQSSTNGVMTAVANDETAIGYISLGSLSNDVKAVTVGGVAASAETVKDGSYVLSRPFNIVTNGDATDPVAVDFIAYVLSKDGQAIATDNGYITSAKEFSITYSTIGNAATDERFFIGQSKMTWRRSRCKDKRLCLKFTQQLRANAEAVIVF